MYKLLLFFALLFCVVTGAQAQKSCCVINAPATFAALGNDQAFTNAHENPAPYVYSDEPGKNITFRAMDGKDAHAFAVMASQPTQHYLLVFHEFYGLNDYVKKESARLAKELGNVNVLALDLYDGKVGATREEATKLMQAVDSKRAVAIIEGAVRHIGPEARVATLGWCFGGSWSLQAALHADKQAVGCVMYYGQPETDIERLSDLDCSVLGIFALQDKWLTPKVVQQFEADMRKAGKKLTVYQFDADHAFANPSSPRYDSADAQKANKIALDYLKKSFGIN